MKLKKTTINELKEILKQEFNLSLTSKDLNKFAYSLIGLFDLLNRIENRHKFENRTSEAIDHT